MKPRKGSSTPPQAAQAVQAPPPQASMVSSGGTQPAPSDSYAPQVVKEMEKLEKLFVATRDLMSSIETESKIRVKLCEQRYELSRNMNKLAMSMAGSPNANWVVKAAAVHGELVKSEKRFTEEIQKQCLAPLNEFMTKSYAGLKEKYNQYEQCRFRYDAARNELNNCASDMALVEAKGAVAEKAKDEFQKSSETFHQEFQAMEIYKYKLAKLIDTYGQLENIFVKEVNQMLDSISPLAPSKT